MCVLFGTNPVERPELTGDRAQNLKTLGELPAGTLIFWDGQIGPAWFNLTDKDIENLGYKRLYSKSYDLRGWILGELKFRFGGVRHQEMHFFYRE